MNEAKDIQPLLQEVGTLYQNLAMENTALKAKIADLETELQAIKDDRNQITQTLQDTQGRLDRFHPDMQTLHDQLERTEVELNMLSIESTKKDEEIQQLENRIQELSKPKEESGSADRAFQKEPLGYYGI